MKRISVIAFLIITVCLNFYSNKSLYNFHKNSEESAVSSIYTLPIPLVRALSFEFTGPVADFLFMKTLVFLGDRIETRKQVTTTEWDYVYKALKTISNLDPHFQDPYVLAETTLPWDAGMIKETNDLLQIAIDTDPDDFRPYYFIFFNYFYFNKDAKSAFPYIKKAATCKNSPPYFKTLAARMALYAGDNRAGILFLEEMLQQSHDEYTKKIMEKRLDAMKRMFFLEEKIQLYVKQTGRAPQKLDQLIEEGIITKIPEDPYGGRFFINDHGRVYSTSKLATGK